MSARAPGTGAGLRVGAAAIDVALPQTQCARCGHDGCAPYAEAVARGAAPPNRCVPGGEATVRVLAGLLGAQPGRLDLGGGVPSRWRLAVIDEPACIGCALCLDACPVDAIVGARRLTHTVLEAECTGCELCLPACPVDCIHLGEPCEARDPVRGVRRADEPGFLEAWLGVRAGPARSRAARRRERLARRGLRRQPGRARRGAGSGAAEPGPGGVGPVGASPAGANPGQDAPGLAPRAASVDERRAVVAHALARARARQAR